MLKTSYNTVFVTHYVYPNPPLADFTNTGNVKRGIYEYNIETKRKFLSSKAKRRSGLLKHDKIVKTFFTV